MKKNLEEMSLSQILFSFRGRISRGLWWESSFTVWCVSLFFELLFISILSNGEIATVTAIVKSSLFFIFIILNLWINLALQVKRWHDRNKSGWMALVNLIPIFGGIWVLVEVGFLKGTKGPNRYGEDPLQLIEGKREISLVFQISRAINSLGLIMAVLITLLTVTDIIGRYLFNCPIVGSYEMNAYMMVVLVAFGLAYTEIRGGHIRIHSVISRLTPQIQAMVRSITTLLCLGVFTVITWQSFLQAGRLRSRGSLSILLNIPEYPFLYAMAFGTSILCLVFIFKIYEHLSKAIKGGQWLVYAGLPLLIILVLVIFTMPFWGLEWLNGLSPNSIAIFGICTLFVLLFFRMPSGIAMALVGFLGMTIIIGGEPSLMMLGVVSYDAVKSYPLIAIPLFLLMTAILQQSGIAQAVYLSATSWFGHLPGGALLSGMAASTSNSTINATSQSGAATIGTMALPQITEHNYKQSLSIGSIAAGSTIALLIPPSMGLIIYGIFTEQSIGRLFCAGLIPGALMSFCFMLYVLLAGCISRNSIGNDHVPSIKQSVIGFIMLLPLGVWIIPFIGMSVGIFTPVEGSALAVLIAFIMALIWTPVWGRSILSVLYKSLLQAVHTTCMIALILIGAYMFSTFLTLTRIPFTFVEYIDGLAMPRLLILAFIFLVYIFLSLFMEPLTLMVLSLGLVLPLIASLGFDPLWFGTVLMLLIGIGMMVQLVPMNWRLADSSTTIFPFKAVITAIAPFAIIMMFLICLLVIFPQLALWLPNSIS